MNHHRPRAIPREVMRWTWLGLKLQGLGHPDIRRLIVRCVGEYAWELGLEEVQCEHNWVWLHHLGPSLGEVLRELCNIVSPAPDHSASYQVALYKWRYRNVVGGMAVIWRR